MARVLRTAKIKITTKCNRNCRFCIFSPRASRADMPFERFQLIVSRLSRIRFIRLGIGGGEPTLHKDFARISTAARRMMGSGELVLGTNIVYAARNARIMGVICEHYDKVMIGCDDEHRNYDHVVRALPILRSYGIKVGINTILEACSPQLLRRLSVLCEKHGVKHHKSTIHHIDMGQPENVLHGVCYRNRGRHLMIQEDGACYRCFNAMSKADSEFNIFDPAFEEKVFMRRTKHYHFCRKCHDYLDSGVPPA